MKAKDFIEKAKSITSLKTLYVYGCFGAPMNASNKKRYIKEYVYNSQPERANMIILASSATFGFDCCGLIKAILWGFNADIMQTYGGSVYASGFPDIGTEQMITDKYCSYISDDFDNITPGEIVYMPGHVGIYIGNKQVVECTPAWKNGVQITNLSQHKWLKHGMLRAIDFTGNSKDTTPSTETKYYRVQVGAYAKKENAEKIQKEIISKGYNAIIKYY